MRSTTRETVPNSVDKSLTKKSHQLAKVRVAGSNPSSAPSFSALAGVAMILRWPESRLESMTRSTARSMSQRPGSSSSEAVSRADGTVSPFGPHSTTRSSLAGTASL